MLSAVDIANLIGKPPPTPEQVAAIEAPLEPNLIVAGAGSGKTETMASRVVWLIANGLVAPDRILGLTFTRKAAGELQHRVRARLAQLASARADTIAVADATLDLLARPQVATYNGYAAGLVSEHGLRIGIEPGSQLLGEAARWQLATEIVEAFDGDLRSTRGANGLTRAVVSLASQIGEHLLSPDDVRAFLTAAVAHVESLPFGLTPTGKPKKARGPEIEKFLGSLQERRDLMQLVESYVERKRQADSMDYGDQIALGAKLAHEVPQVSALERERFQVVLLDEYQDTSYAQVELLANLFGGGHAVTAVGDPHQSIYGWRGASASGLTRFPSRFRRADGTDAQVLYLSTSWRNDQAILRCANVVSEPLRAALATPVPELTLSPLAKVGSVAAQVLTTVDEEADAIARWIKERWRPRSHPDGQATAAVLCRARKQFDAIATALRAEGLPVEVVGLGGLLATPEVVDVVALLEAVNDPSRGDSILRLLTGPRVNLGAADLHALGAFAAKLVRDAENSPSALNSVTTTSDAPNVKASDADPAEPIVIEGDVTDQRSLIDAVDSLPPAGTTSRLNWAGRTLSNIGHARLLKLQATLRELRSLTYLSLAELVVAAERALGLDIEVVANGMGRANLDAFREVAASFARSADSANLGAFLAWLDIASTEERGLDLPLRAPHPDAVQVSTVHAAKGLEWHAVAVAGLVDGQFPTTPERADGSRSDNGWLNSVNDLPYPLRGDATDLPQMDFEAVSHCGELEQIRAAFAAANGESKLAEERRLAYVAFTRARRDLLLTAYWWGWGTQEKPRKPSLFLTELVDAGLVSADEWVDPPAKDDKNPLAANEHTAYWPSSPNKPDGANAEEGTASTPNQAQSDASATPDPTAIAWPINELPNLARLLLTELHRPDASEVAMPAHLSASGLVRLAQDRDAFTMQLRRPVPQQPTLHARRGTRFHEWVEQHFTSATLFALDDLPGSDDLDSPPDADLETLKETFLNSPWASLQPLAIEQDVETPLAGVMTRCRIDAVFPDPDWTPPAGSACDATNTATTGGVVIVDWKTGRPPQDPTVIQAREVQLAVYRLAWSRWTGLPLDQVNAAFYYVGSGETVRPEHLATESELEALIAGS